MIKRIFSLSFLLFSFSVLVQAQVPRSALMDHSPLGANLRNAACSDQFAGTVTVDAANFSGQSNDIDLSEIYLCFGDILPFIHNRDQDLTGDPVTTTPPGVGYALYTDQPTVSGPDLATILTDPALLTIPAPPGGIYVFTDDISGDATFSNLIQVDSDGDNVADQTLPDFFNNGDPFRIWFAPITFDRLVFSQATYEGNPSGPCVNANIAAAFSVVYLNPIATSNTSSSANAGSFTVTGGLPEFDGSNYTNISIALNTDPTITGTITSGAASDGSQVDFTVPQPGLYDITITDDKGCPHTFQMTITQFDPLVLALNCDFGQPNDEVCIPMTVRDFDEIIGIQLALNWDSTILEFSRVANINLQDLDQFAFNSDSSGVLLFQWFDFGGIGVTVADGASIFEVCFNVVGTADEQAIISFNDPPDQFSFIEISRAGNVQIDLDSLSGKIYVGSPPAVDINVSNVSSTPCDPTQPGGSITFSANDGLAGGYQYQWENTTSGETGAGMMANNSTETINSLSAGDYSVTVVDQGCGFATFTQNIPQSNLGVSINTTQPTCNGGMDGEVEAIVFESGVQVTNLAGYTFSWQGSAVTTSTLNNVPSGTYRVTVTAPDGCQADAAETLSQPSAINIGVNKVDESCNIGGDGSISITPTGGTVAGAYTYSWADIPDDIDTRTGLGAGQYDLTVTDDNLCEQTRTIIINVPTPPTVTGFDSTSVACVNDTNGSLTVNVTPNNGTTITAYNWTGPNGFAGTGQTIGGLLPGKYFVNITASDGCIVLDSATLFAPSSLMLVDTIKMNPTCPGDDDGSISVQISGGTTPYFYRWSTGDSGNNFSALPRVTAGVYGVTVIDANACDSLALNVTLEDPASIAAQFTNIQAVSCFDGIPCDGGATVLASGGSSTTGLYDFIWESGETDLGVSSSTATQLCQGSQFVVISDGVCGDTFYVDIPTPDRLNIDISASEFTDASCNGDTDGSITVVPTGGTPAYTFLWQDGTTGPTLSNIPTGTYTVEVSDANGCILPFSPQIGEPDVMVASIDSANTMDVSCFGETDAVVAVKWEGGNGPGGETYTWTPNVTDAATATNLGAGDYSILVTDRKGCSSTTQYTVTTPTPVQALIPDPDEPLCFGFQTPVTVFSATGGVGGPYTFSVNNGPQQQLDAAIPVFAGQDIPVSVFDGAGCSYDTTLTINEPPEIIVDLGPDIEVPLGDSTVLDPFIGSVKPIDSIRWTPTDQFFRCPDPTRFDCLRPIIKPLTPATYVMTVVDQDGCIGMDDIFIDVDKNRNVFLPNVFSPDGNGVNDEFFPQAGPGIEIVNSMKIFDRWGELMYNIENFDANDRSKGWDGRYRSKKVNPGVYVYLVEVTFLDGITLLYRGDVAIMK